MKYLLLLTLLLPSFSYAKEDEKICIPKEEYEAILEVMQAQIEVIDDLTKKAKILEKLQKANPELDLEEFEIVIDKSGRVFIKEGINGSLKLDHLSYNVNIKLKPTIVKAKNKQYGFDLKFKAAAVTTYELEEDNQLKAYTSGALAIEPFYYRNFNLNLLIGPRLYGPAIGVDITKHFGGLAGIGFKYNNEKAFFVGAAFDF